MSSEARLTVNLQINAGNLQYQNRPTAFTADVTGRKGPCPGAITVTTVGGNVDFSQLSTPGLCILHNLDLTNFVQYGIHDGVTFHPVGEILPGELYLLRLSRNLGEIYGEATGTGTTAVVNQLYLKADKASCVVDVSGFEA